MNVRCSLRRLTVAAGILAVGLVGGLAPSATCRIRVPESRGDNVADPAARAKWVGGQSRAAQPVPDDPARDWTEAAALGGRAAVPAAIQTKSSPLFHHYLTVAQWTKRFGPTAASQKAVVAWAKSLGPHVTHLYANRLVVDVSGPVAARSEGAGSPDQQLQAGSKTFFANTSDPVLPGVADGDRRVGRRAQQPADDVSGVATATGSRPAPCTSPGPSSRTARTRAGNGSRVEAARGDAGLPQQAEHHGRGV